MGWITARAVVAVGLVVGASGGPPVDADEPLRIEGYRSWRTLTPTPAFVPYHLAVQCDRIRPEQIAAARKEHGPHTNRWIRVYANASALDALRDDGTKVFPPGSILVKEKLRDPADAKPEGVAFMIKHPDGAFAASGGWEFRYVPGTGTLGEYGSCASCHRVGATKDYVFARYAVMPLE